MLCIGHCLGACDVRVGARCPAAGLGSAVLQQGSAVLLQHQKGASPVFGQGACAHRRLCRCVQLRPSRSHRQGPLPFCKGWQQEALHRRICMQAVFCSCMLCNGRWCVSCSEVTVREGQKNVGSTSLHNVSRS